MSKTYQIELKVDDSQAVASGNRSAQAMTRVERAAQRAAEQAERTAERAAAAEERKVQRQAEQQARAAQKALEVQERADQRKAESAQKQADKAAAAQARAAQRQADQAAREADRAAKVQERADQRAVEKAERQAQRQADVAARQARRAADQQVAAAKRAQDRVDALKGRALTDEEVRNKALGAVQDRLNDRRVAAATRVAEAERRAGLGMVGRFKESAGLLIEQINPATVAWTAGLAAAGVAAGELVKHWRDVAKGIEDAVSFQTKYRETLPENASLKGHLGDTTTEAKENLLLRSKTLQTPEQARDFEAGFLNVVQSSIASGRISKDEAEILKQRGGAFQAAENGSAETHGELVGRLPALVAPRKDAAGRNLPVTADQVQAAESQIFEILSAGGSTFSSGVSQLLKNSSLTTTGAFDSIAQQAALQSAFSVNTPAEAGEMTRWLQRASVGSLHDKDTQAYFTRLGVQDQKKAIPIADAVAADLAKAQTAAKAAGKDFSADDYLRTQGFTNDESIRAYMAYTTSSQSGELKSFLDMTKGAPNADAINRKIAESRADPLMQDRSRQATEDLAKFSFDRSHVTADEFRRSVFAAATTTGAMSGRYEDAQNYLTLGPNNPRRLNEHANAWLQFSAKRAGVEVGDLGQYNPFGSQINLDKQYQTAIDKITAAGGDPMADLRGFTAGKAKLNLDRSIAAEAPGRAGLANADARRRAMARIPDLIAAPDRAMGAGLSPASGVADSVLAPLIQKLITLQEDANELARKNQKSDPLPISGKGMIWP